MRLEQRNPMTDRSHQAFIHPLRHALRRTAATLRALTHARQGAVAVAFALLFVPVVMMIGAAVDYARLEQFKTQLQATVDSAALSGAAAYVDASSSSNASTVATNYLSSNETLLPSHVGSITSHVSASQITTGSNQGYTVSVSATAAIGTTFMRLFSPSLNVSASASAVNPIVQITISASNFSANAWDANTLWYWLITNSTPNAQPTVANFASTQKLASNLNSTNGSVTFTATATQKIGMALQNVTGGKGGNYGCSQYQTPQYVRQLVGSGRDATYQEVEDCEGTTQWFFSNMMPPSANTYNQSGYQISQNCSVQVSVSTSLPTTTVPPVSGQCFSSLPQYSYPSCSQLAGEYANFWWNDMGGSTDDKDYNDAEISIQCSGINGAGNSATNVYLSQ
jgi:Flp pilus assembly protein TadG